MAVASGGKGTDGDTGSGEETGRTNARRVRGDYAGNFELTRTINTQRNYILEMEQAMQRYKTLRRNLMQVQDDLIHGRVNDARVGISQVLLEWPMK